MTPNHILRLGNLETSPPGSFGKDDLYVTRKWRQAQFLADMFWYRYRREYLPTLQRRTKWQKVRKNIKPGDVVLITDQAAPRNDWCTALVKSVKLSQDNMVRSCTVELLKNKYDSKGFDKITLDRPVSKLVLLPTDEQL